MAKEPASTDPSMLPFRDMSLDVEQRVDDLLNRLTLEEKISLCSGTKNWMTKTIPRLGIPPWKMTDGPFGLGIHSTYKKNTYFPVSICMGSTWNPELANEFGIAMGEEVRACEYHMDLGPGINIDRTPLNGRTFEYLTEDPCLDGQMAVQIVKGIQSQRAAACVKHFAANNQETRRKSVSSEVSERALQEIYLRAFKKVVQEANPWCIMASYNRINGVYGTESKDLLKNRLIDQWGFNGFIVSDWVALKPTTGVKGCVEANLSLEMPKSFKYTPELMKIALDAKEITVEQIDANLRRLIRVMFWTGLFDDPKTVPKGCRNTLEHQKLARRIAEEGIVLLKNDANILPLNIDTVKKIAILGPNANKHHGALLGGSSEVWAPYEITPLQGLKRHLKGKVQIVKNPADANVVLYFGGLNHYPGNDCEGNDRKSLDLPTNQTDEINRIVAQNKNTIIVLINGSPVTMDPWLEKVPAVIEMWYAGMESGHAIANILLGDSNPCGKLPISFPKKLSDSPAHANSPRTFPGIVPKSGASPAYPQVFYDEGIYVGYRYFDSKNIEPLFPFGFGLSYTSFKYENIQLDTTTLTGDGKLTITADITNSGDRAGAEVVQCYLQDIEASIDRPLKELRAFKKIFLNPGETTAVSFEIAKADLEFFDEKNNTWMAEAGTFKVLLGSSSRDIRLEAEFEYNE